jgi:uncharacterized protein YbjT (DUF2867 family)
LARVLIVGCGCRGQELARALVAEGHAVRGTTRDPAREPAIAATGAEPARADPDCVGTLTSALDGVTVVCWLLGRVPAPELNGPRLRAFLAELVDTTVRGFAHEAAGESDRRIVLDAQETWHIPVAFVEGDQGWPAPALSAVGALLGSPNG